MTILTNILPHILVAPHYYKESDLDNLNDKKKMPKQIK